MLFHQVTGRDSITLLWHFSAMRMVDNEENENDEGDDVEILLRNDDEGRSGGYSHLCTTLLVVVFLLLYVSSLYAPI